MTFAEKLTRAPWTMRSEDVDDLRRAGFGDDAISDGTQVIGYFNYINRIADGLGVDLEPEMPPPATGD
jgi:alkylhydroperoxidase family enzyme